MNEKLLNQNIFKGMFSRLISSGKFCSPRNQKIIELENFCYSLPAYVRFCNFSVRKLNIEYIKREFKWYLKGDRFDTSISENASMWKSLINEDGSINSNYGQYIFSNNAFYTVAEELKKDKDSRRASIMILTNERVKEGCDGKTKDVPCTYSLNFRIRENELKMSVRMRSQDGIYGMGNDIPCFSFIHEMMYVYLRDTYPELKYGEYYHSCDSFHVYEKHFEMIEKITGISMFSKSVVLEDEYEEVSCPRISSKEEVDFLIQHDFSKIPETFNFAKWLNNIA